MPDGLLCRLLSPQILRAGGAIQSTPFIFRLPSSPRCRRALSSKPFSRRSLICGPRCPMHALESNACLPQNFMRQCAFKMSMPSSPRPASFADLQSQGLAEQLAAYRSADATDLAYVSGMAVVRPKKSSVHDLEDLKNLHILSDAQDSFGTWMIFEGQLERTGLDAVAFLSRTTFNTYIAPTPLERLEAGEGDAAVVAWCELEKLAQQGFPAEHFRVVGDLQNLTNAVPGPGCFIRAPSSALRHM